MSQRSAAEGAEGSRGVLRSGLSSKDSSADWKVSLPLVKNRQVFQDIPCRELSVKGRHNKAARPAISTRLTSVVITKKLSTKGRRTKAG